MGGQVVADGAELEEEESLQLVDFLRLGGGENGDFDRVGVQAIKLAAAGFEGVDEFPAIRRDERGLVGVLAVVGFGNEILRRGIYREGRDKTLTAHLPSSDIVRQSSN